MGNAVKDVAPHALPGNAAKRSERDRATIAKRLKDADKPRRVTPRCNPRPFQAKPKPEGYTAGRPSDYRPEYCQAVIDLMGEGYDLTAFAGSIRVCRTTVYEWQLAHAEFANAVKIAKAARLFALQTKLLTTKMGVGVTAAIFALKNAAPEDWQDRFNTQTDINVRIEKLTDAQLTEIAAQARTIDVTPSARELPSPLPHDKPQSE